MAYSPKRDEADNKDPQTKEHGEWFSKGHREGWNAGALDSQKKQVTLDLYRALESVRGVKQNNNTATPDYITVIEAKVLEAIERIQRTY